MAKYTDDDYCDIYEKKICDNCGKCLEAEGIDIRAIKIEDIAKNVEENEMLEKEYREQLAQEKYDKEELDDCIVDNEDYNSLYDTYDKLLDGVEESIDDEDAEYEDAFDHIEYLDDAGLFDESNLEELTEEVFPGVRKLKNRHKD